MDMHMPAAIGTAVPICQPPSWHPGASVLLDKQNQIGVQTMHTIACARRGGGLTLRRG